VAVREFDWRTCWTKRPDIWHCHWPEYYIGQRSKRRAIAGSVAVLAYATYCRLLGTRIVWTAHNLQPHDGLTRARAVRLFYRLWCGLPNGLVFLSEASRSEALTRYPSLRKAPAVVSPHGPYECSGRANRAAGDSVLFVGQVRPYKGVRDLIPIAAAGIPVTVAGACIDSELRRHLEAEAEAVGGRLRLLLHHQTEEQLEELLHTHRLVVLPYARVHNSGTLILALSHGRPVLAVNHPTLHELRDAIPSGVQLYGDGDLPQAVRKLFASPPWGSQNEIEAELQQYCAWDKVARSHNVLYSLVIRSATRRQASEWGSPVA